MPSYIEIHEDDREPRARMVMTDKITNEVRYGLWLSQSVAEWFAKYGNKHYPNIAHTIELHPDNTNAQHV